MTKLVYVVKKNIRHELMIHLSLAIVLCLLVPMVFSLNDLDQYLASLPLETIVILTGVVILVPLFLPEQDKAVFDVMYTKQTPPLYVNIVRTVYSILSVLLIPAVFLLAMHLLHSDVRMVHYLGTVSSALFLGGLGALVFAVSNNISVSYMVPVIWYVMCMGAGKHLKMFDVMMMSHGKIDPKSLQLIIGLVLLAAAVIFKSSRKSSCC